MSVIKISNLQHKNFIRFLKYLSPYWRKGFAAFLFMLLSVGLQLPIPFLTRYIIDQVLVVENMQLLNMICYVIIGVIIIRGIMGFLETYLLTIFRGRVLFDIRLRLFEHIQKLSLSFFNKKQTGYLVSRISADVNAVQGLLADTIVSAGQSILIFLAGIACTFYIHPQLALFCFSIVPLYLLSMVIFNKRIRDKSYEFRENYALVQKDLHELLSGISLIKSFTGEKRVTIQVLRKIKNAIRTQIKLDITATLASLSSYTISAAGPIIILWYGCAEIMRGDLTLGSLIAFTSFVGYLFGPTASLYNINLSIQRSLAAVERIFEILDAKPERDGKKKIAIRQGRVVFDDVSFSYHEGGFVLKNISFEVNPGETIAIIGRSGVGKTTLVSLLPRFYNPNKGRITIDGEDIQDMQLRSLRKGIGICAQDTFLFSDTIRENIKFGNPHLTNGKIEEVARLAYANGFIQNLPEKYETRVGERGVNLSGGERQRIAIARALLKDPRILILDEAMSQIDIKSEKFIQKALQNLFKNRTTFVIAHRLSTIQSANKIIVLSNGQIIDQGKHDKLFGRCAVYRDLYKAQFNKDDNLHHITSAVN